MRSFGCGGFIFEFVNIFLAIVKYLKMDILVNNKLDAMRDFWDGFGFVFKL